MPAVVQHLAGLVDALDVASARRDARSRSTPAMPAERVSFAGPGKTPAELAPGGRRRRHSSSSSRRARPTRVAAIGERLGVAPARRGPGQPGLRGQGLGHAHGRRAAAVRRRRRAACPALLARAGRAGVDLLGLPHLRRLAEPARRDPRAKRSGRRSSSRCGWPTTCRRRSATSTSAAGSASRTSERDQPLDLAPVGDEPRRAAAPSACSRALPEARVVHRARALPGRRGGRLRHPRRRPQGVARPDLPGRRRRACTTSSPRPATSGR